MVHKQICYVGTYTQEMSHVPESKGKGIHLFEFDADRGILTDTGMVYDVANPSYLSISHNQQYLYATSEVGAGYVSAFVIDSSSGALSYLNQQSTYGSATAYVSVDREDQYVFAANYWDGQSIAMLPINDSGGLSAASSTYEHTLVAAKTVPSRQDKSHSHCIISTPDNRFVLVCDLGLDKIMVYQLDAQNHQLVPHDIPFFDMHAGAGCRHVIFHPTHNTVYVINELDSSVTVLSFDAIDGQLKYQQRISTLPQSFTGYNSTSDIHVSPDGQYLYAGNRGHDSIAIYAIHKNTGQLTYLDHQTTGGKTPRNFAIDPSGTIVLVANQDSHNIVSFRRNPQTGLLTQLSTIECPTPVCLKIATLIR